MGSGIDTDRAFRWNIGRLIYESDDTVASKSNLAACRQRGIGVGLMRNPDWPRDTLSDRDVATALHEDLVEKGFGTNTGPDSCWAVFNNERQGSDKILTMLKRWRELRPTRKTIWSPMCFQGGWFSKELVDFINNDLNLLACPQAYVNDMRPGTDPEYDPMYPAYAPAVIEDLARVGVRRDKIILFLDATRHEISYGWEGILFGFNALDPSPPMPL